MIGGWGRKAEGLHELDLKPIPSGLDDDLGEYYQDFLPILSIVEAEHHGPLDPAGIPLVHYGGQGARYNAITVAQYALANLSAVRRGESAREPLTRRLSEWLIEAQEGPGEYAGLWRQPFDNPKYPWLKAGWVSAMAQGNGISALLRAEEAFGDGKFGAAARAAYHGLHRARGDLPLWTESSEEIWYEEYPASPPLRVLNGHIYTLLGVLDIARKMRDPEADKRWRKAVAAVHQHLEQFDLGFWSAYDLREREPVSLHYHKNIHIPQLRILGTLTGNPTFQKTADRWEGYLSDNRARLRTWVASRLHARKKWILRRVHAGGSKETGSVR